jgi:hypothetical protein
MKILMIAINDPAGTAIAFTNAINQYTDHSCRLITKEIRYNFMFEKDLHLPWLLTKDAWDEVEALLIESDILHFHMTADEHIHLGPFKVVDFVHGKKIVHHHHGHPDFRSNPGKYRKKYAYLNRRNLIVSTPDLLKLLPVAKWIPNLVPLNNLLYLPEDISYNGTVVVGQSPTRQYLKDTELFFDVINGLQNRMSPRTVKLDIITNTNHRECLKKKKKCHIIFDHMQGYYGVSSLESLSQGKPVLAGLDDWNIQNIKNLFGAHQLPWCIVKSREDLENELRKLIRSEERRQRISRFSRKFMENYWSDLRVVSILNQFYESLN